MPDFWVLHEDCLERDTVARGLVGSGLALGYSARLRIAGPPFSTSFYNFRPSEIAWERFFLVFSVSNRLLSCGNPSDVYVQHELKVVTCLL